jgi:hypothetical protein
LGTKTDTIGGAESEEMEHVRTIRAHFVGSYDDVVCDRLRVGCRVSWRSVRASG